MKFYILTAILVTRCALAAPTTTTTSEAATTSTTAKTYLPQVSPIFPSIAPATDVVTSYNAGPYNLSAALPTYQLSGYPEVWQVPNVSHPEVVAAVKQINWDLVPKAPVRYQNPKTGLFEPDTDGPTDPYCWWSDTNCLHPKINLPADYYKCDQPDMWGLSYDDGPFNRYTGKYASLENPYAEPALYNFLAEHNNQKANLMYIGSNVVSYPAAAKRGFNDGHYLCVHTWSHPPMTTMTNDEAVAEFYWTLKAIKEATGVTPMCWRPPQGDVDDRIRAIAWQMGLHTVMWNWDSEDWDMPAPGGGNLPVATVNSYFEGWLAQGEAHNLTVGHIVLEHELNSQTVGMTEKWLPSLQKVFNVIPALACNNVSQPYWEKQFVYPLVNQPAAQNGTLKY